MANCAKSQAALTALAFAGGRHQTHADVQQLALEGFLEGSATPEPYLDFEPHANRRPTSSPGKHSYLIPSRRYEE